MPVKIKIKSILPFLSLVLFIYVPYGRVIGMLFVGIGCR